MNPKLLTTIFSILLFPITPKFFAQPVIFTEPLSPRIANYDIDVKLNTETRMLEGREILTWYNKSNDAVHELQFHLYLNAFRNNRSTFMIEGGSRHRDFRIARKEGWGYIEISKINILSGENSITGIKLLKMNSSEMDSAYKVFDLTNRIEFIQPDDGNEYDKTVFRLELPNPVPINDFVTLYIEFTAKLPIPPSYRTGAKKEYFFVGQWFPKIGVYTQDGWNTHQFHYESEFFADFGVYNVFITVPVENMVGATGLEVEVTDNDDGTATHFYHAEDVHDFAWTTSPEFVEFNDKTQDVDIRLLIQPDHVEQSQRHLDAAKLTIECFQNWYGDYPFPNLTIVDPRRGASGTGGMEYPTLITGLTRYRLPEGFRLVEDVIIHEFGS
jgi:hypothetical protein